MTTTPLHPAPTQIASVVHPLEPLTAKEIAAAVAIVRTEKILGRSFRFATVVLKEPAKSVVLNFQDGDKIERQAFLILLDNATGKTYEAIVSITKSTILSWNEIPDVQPGIMLDEFIECEAAVKANPEFRAALQRRGITDIDLVMVDPWSAGNFGITEEAGLRLSRALCWIRSPTH